MGKILQRRTSLGWQSDKVRSLNKKLCELVRATNKATYLWMNRQIRFNMPSYFSGQNSWFTPSWSQVRILHSVIMEKVKCKKCNGTGWIEEKKYQCVPNKEEYSGFIAILYLECECKKEKKVA